MLIPPKATPEEKRILKAFRDCKVIEHEGRRVRVLDAYYERPDKNGRFRLRIKVEDA